MSPAKFGPGARGRRGGQQSAGCVARCSVDALLALAQPAQSAAANSATRRSSTRCGGCWRPAPRRRRSAWSGGWRRAGTWCASSPTCCASTTAEQRDPGILRQPIERPIFITGLPRSGTTFLHRLLLEDPDNRAPRVWQTIYPYPPEPAARTMRGRRAWRGSCARSSGWRRSSAGCIRWMPPRRRNAARSPPTCSAACGSTRPTASRAIGDWLDQAGHLPAYRFHRRFLQHLQHQAPGGRWVVKCPDHLFALDAIRAVYPGRPAGLRASRSGEGAAVGGEAHRGGAAARSPGGSIRAEIGRAGERPLAGGHGADDGRRRRCRAAGADPPCAPHGAGGGPGRHGRPALYRHFGLHAARPVPLPRSSSTPGSGRTAAMVRATTGSRTTGSTQAWSGRSSAATCSASASPSRLCHCDRLRIPTRHPRASGMTDGGSWHGSIAPERLVGLRLSLGEADADVLQQVARRGRRSAGAMR